MKRVGAILLIILLLEVILGFYTYPKLPDKVVTHWNNQGQPNGYTPKVWAFFWMISLSCGLILLFMLIPKIDPLKRNFKKFREAYNDFVLLIILFLFYIYTLLILWNLNVKFPMIQMLIPIYSLLFYYSGILMEKVKRNWFVGIRTPWTLSSEQVWEKTHKLGSRLFKLAGVVALSTTFFPKYSLFLIMTLIIFVTLYTVFYSHFEYKKEKGI